MSTATDGRRREHKPVADRFAARVPKLAPDACWPWQGYVRPDGYGSFMGEGQRTVFAHRYAYEAAAGSIPDGLTIDHLCKLRSCVNVRHMEVVTRAENTRRARSWEGASRARTAKAASGCPRRHPWTPENTYTSPAGHRECRTCRAERESRRVR